MSSSILLLLPTGAWLQVQTHGQQAPRYPLFTPQWLMLLRWPLGACVLCVGHQDPTLSPLLSIPTVCGPHMSSYVHITTYALPSLSVLNHRKILILPGLQVDLSVCPVPSARVFDN